MIDNNGIEKIISRIPFGKACIYGASINSELDEL
jgi:hypothetical protein